MPVNAVVQRILSAAENDDSKILGVVYSGKPITTKQYIPRAGKPSPPPDLPTLREAQLTAIPEAQTAPSITFNGTTPNTTYLVVALDLDAPFPSFGVLGPILHWIQPGFKAGPGGALTTTESFVANYSESFPYSLPNKRYLQSLRTRAPSYFLPYRP